MQVPTQYFNLKNGSYREIGDNKTAIDCCLNDGQYEIFPLINMDQWDDKDFVFRFRLEMGIVAKYWA